MPAFIDLTGQKIHEWTVICRAHLKPRRTQWLCRCKCGKDSIVQSSHLISGKSKKCKICHNKIAVGKRPLKHGGCKYKNSSEYVTWISMKTRCLNPNDDHWPNYGGRGIEICKEWENDFLSFKTDMGHRPKNCSLDRIDNSKGYSKENCRWASHRQQCENKRTNVTLELNGIVKTKTQWARDYGIPYSSFSRLIKKTGWPLTNLPKE